MTTSEQSTNQWDATSYANRSNLLRVIRTEADRLIALAERPENWEAPTTSGHWQVRDVIGHLVDTTEEYLRGFATARRGEPAPEPHGLRAMATLADRGALSFRGTAQPEMIARLRASLDELLRNFERLDEAEWTGFLVPHAYMGPLPAFLFAVFQLMDYGVHGWDVREGLKLPHALSADVADFLVPYMFVLWQATADLDRVRGINDVIGVRVSGRNGGTWRVTLGSNGYAYESGPVDGLSTILEFDPGSLVLTAFGRVRGGTVFGDPELAGRYYSAFFLI